MPAPQQRRAFSAYYGASVTEFLATAPETVIGVLAMADMRGALDAEQRRAWDEEIGVLRSALAGLDGMLFLEFDVPRLGSRIDAALVSGPAVFPIEFKCGEQRYTTDAHNQAWDYGLDLKNFHQATHAAPVFPILVATRATAGDSAWQPPHDDGVRPPRRSTVADLKRAIQEALAQVAGAALDGDAWGRASYQPTPTIIEAARALYSRHTVDAITRNDAGAKNLQVTSGRVEEIIEEARSRHEKAIVFVTGVPGAGKTLVGLNVATRRRTFGEARVDGGWRHHSFRGDVWTNVNKPDRQRYLLNAYRVLLTRARQGMAIFVPPGDRRDPTRLPEFYDGTFEYLTELGLPLA